MASLKVMLSSTLRKIIMFFYSDSASKSQQAKIWPIEATPGTSILIKRCVSISKHLFPVVARSVLAVKHWWTGAKQKSYTPLLKGKTLT